MELSELIAELNKLPKNTLVAALRESVKPVYTAIFTKGHGEATERAQQRQDALQTEIDELKKKVPDDGAVVLKGEEAKEYESLKALGKASEIKAKLEKTDELQQKLDTRTREDGMRAAADAHGYNFAVLKDLPGAAAGTFEVREEGDKKEKVVYFTPGEKDAKPVKLTEHAKSAWEAFLPALEANANGGDRRSGSNDRSFARQSGTERPAGGGKELTVEEIAERQRSSGMYGL